MNYVGLDIHKKFTYGVIKDEEGRIINEDKFNNDPESFNSFLINSSPEQTKIVMESTGVWEFIFEMLESKKYNVKLANPMKTKAIAWARIKTDSVDASTLADLLRANLIAESYVPEKEIRNLRDIVRQRKTLVRGRTQIKNKIHAILNRHGIKLPYKTLCKSAIQWALEEVKDANIKTVLVSCINLLGQYDNETKLIEEKIKSTAYQNEDAKLLMTISGLGSIRALEVISEIGAISRFESADKLCSYAGLVPSIKQSGTSLRFGRLVQQSSRSLKNTLIEASWVAVRVKEENQLSAFFKKLCKKKSKQKAICATARKLCCVIHAMLRKREEFKDFIIL